MIKIREAIVVEGRYDKNALSQLVDTVIIETGGFGIFNDRERLAYIRKLAARRGIIVMTDGDGAGFVIRRYLKGAVDPKDVKHAYIPDIPGRERRKRTASREGSLALRGCARKCCLRRCVPAVQPSKMKTPRHPARRLQKPTSMQTVFWVGPGSSRLRAALLRELALPERQTANGLLEALNVMCSREEYEAALAAAREAVRKSSYKMGIARAALRLGRATPVRLSRIRPFKSTCRLLTNVLHYSCKLLQGGVKFPIGGKRMFLREPASRVLRQSPGMIPAPTVTVRMEEAMFFVCVHFLHALKVQCMGVFFYENKCPPSWSIWRSSAAVSVALSM